MTESEHNQYEYDALIGAIILAIDMKWKKDGPQTGGVPAPPVYSFQLMDEEGIQAIQAQLKVMWPNVPLRVSKGYDSILVTTWENHKPNNT